ncbi:MAG TPA: hypothetical protein VKU80_04495, partial [Planctomycetota bacterium]|nr:hypothetical protein [Planctomycetota bacterium]
PGLKLAASLPGRLDRPKPGQDLLELCWKAGAEVETPAAGQLLQVELPPRLGKLDADPARQGRQEEQSDDEDRCQRS